SGDFRADLYHRLSVYPVHIPPLRERDHDILLLAGHFLEFNRTRLGLRGVRLSYAAERALLSYGWPGNVRELEHVISRAALKMLSRGASRDQILTLGPELLDLDIVEPAGEKFQDIHVSRIDGTSPSNADALTQEADDDLYANEPFYGPGTSLIANPASPYSHEQKIVPMRTALEDCQRQAVQHALTSTNYNWAQAARSLQLDSSNLHKLAKKLGLK
ncbi:MAG TPA: hypothetical protein VL002_13905, partial [Candidimonas sp.]|nr:hypothetical protein [Candidimonas sp.]